MRTVGQRRVDDVLSPVPVPGALERAGAHMALVFAFENRVMIRRGVYRRSHAEANRQKDDATVALMTAIARERAGE